MNGKTAVRGLLCLLVGCDYILVVYTGGDVIYCQKECTRCGRVQEGDEL